MGEPRKSKIMLHATVIGFFASRLCILLSFIMVFWDELWRTREDGTINILFGKIFVDARLVRHGLPSQPAG